MANPEHVEILKKGVKVWNRWRQENQELLPDLRVTGLPVRELQGADLSKAHLNAVNLSWANLSEANLSGASLQGTNLRGADLSRADLRGANLNGVSLWGVTLDGTELSRAVFSNTLISDVDLSGSRGLEKVFHTGPSSIGIDTIYKSRGQIPEVFLRGCGVPENFITYMKSLAMNPIEYYSCFISHSTKDTEFAERLYSDLQHKAVRCWYAPEDMKGGKKLYPQIDEAIKFHDKLVLILSESSINSPWVATEIKRTKRYEQQEGKQRLFPISLMPFGELRDWELFDADSGTDLAAEVRSYFIPDFSNWKDHDSYKKAFDRLLKDLKAGE